MKWFGSAAHSLESQIKIKESQITCRRRAIAGDSKDISRQLKSKLSSPQSLLTALALGYIFGELTSVPKAAKPRKRGHTVEARMDGSTRYVKATPLMQLVRLMALTYGLLKTWPTSLLFARLRPLFEPSRPAAQNKSAPNERNARPGEAPTPGQTRI